MDVSEVLSTECRRAGLTLREPDDHLLILEHSASILGVFPATVPASVIRKSAEQWLKRLQGVQR